MSGKSQDGVLGAASAMGLATFFSRILGLVREQVFAVLFGAGNATDAFNVAFRIPNLLRDLFAEGAMSAALVPTFTRVREEGGARAGWRLAGLVFRALFGVVSVLALFGVFFSEELVGLYASSYRSIPGKFEQTVQMTRIMFPFFPLVALAAAYMGVLNALGKFFLPGFASALFNLSSIIVGVTGSFLAPRLGFPPIYGMAVGVVLGGLVQAFCQLPELRRQGYRWQPRAADEAPWYRDRGLRRIGALMIPGMMGLAATQINVLVNTILATSQGAGAVSWLNYAFRLMQFPIGIFGVALASATLPVVSRQWVAREYDAIGSTLSQSLRQVFAVNLPAAVGLACLGQPISQLLFQYGRFTSVDAAATAHALAAYAVGLGAYSAVKVLVPACYAMGRTRVAVISSALSVAFTVAFNLLLIDRWGYVGLALGTSLSAFMNFFFLLFSVRSAVRQEGGQFALLPVFFSVLRSAIASVAMGGVCYLSWVYLEGMIPENLVVEVAHGPWILPFWRAAKVGVLCLEGVGVVLLLARILRIQEIVSAMELLKSKIFKKIARRAG